MTSAVYVDTSALGRVLLHEPDRSVIERDLNPFKRRIASRLLSVELRRIGLRDNCLDEVDRLLADISLIPMDEEILAAAETIPPSTVASLDAIHLATAVKLADTDGLDAIMTYDKRLADGAREHGLTVLIPS
ncbi:MAG: PIN domain-containing protein [Solirubrobacteraceae bacterium]